MILGRKVINISKFPEIIEVKLNHKSKPIGICLNKAIGLGNRSGNNINNFLLPIIGHNNGLKYIAFLFLNNFLIRVINDFQYLIVIYDSFMIPTKFYQALVYYVLEHEVKVGLGWTDA
jgi:hypothetical protein